MDGKRRLRSVVIVAATAAAAAIMVRVIEGGCHDRWLRQSSAVGPRVLSQEKITVALVGRCGKRVV